LTILIWLDYYNLINYSNTAVLL